MHADRLINRVILNNVDCIFLTIYPFEHRIRDGHTEKNGNDWHWLDSMNGSVTHPTYMVSGATLLDIDEAYRANEWANAIHAFKVLYTFPNLSYQPPGSFSPLSAGQP